MKITIYKSSGRYGLTSPIVIDCKDKGTKDNPILIEPLEEIPKNFIVRGYKYYIVIKGFKSSYILIENCQNILIEETELNRLRIERCSKITIRNFTCVSRLTLYRCRNVSIENSFIARLRLFKSSDNSIRNNFIVRLKEIDSKNNQLELNDIRKVQMSKSFNYWASEYQTRCAFLFMLFFAIIILSIPFMLGADTAMRWIIAIIPFSLLGIFLGVCVVMMIYLAAIRPILNKHNERLIEKEKIKVGVQKIHIEKKIIEEQKDLKEKVIKSKVIEQSPKIKNAYSGYIEIDDEIIEEFGIQGDGTKKNPYIINSTENLPQKIEIYESKYYINIVNCDLTSHFLGLYFSQNILVENCKLNYCEVGSSSNIKIIKCSFNDGLRIIRSKEVISENSFISKLSLHNSFNNYLIKCEIEEFLIDESRGNTFQKCSIPPDLLTEDKLNPPIKKYSVTDIIVMLLIVFTFLFVPIATFMYGGFLFALIITIIVGVIVFCVLTPFRLLRKETQSLETGKFDPKDIKKHAPNKVI